MKSSMKGWIVCLVAACFFSYELVQFHMLNAIAPMVIKSLSLSTTQFSALCSTYLLADVIFLIPAGIILDRIPVRRVILFALGLCILGTFGFAISTNFFCAAASHFLSGIGNAFCFLSCMMLASSWFGNKSSFVMSVMITIGLLGGVVAQLPFTLLAENFGWQMTLVIDGLVGCLIWILNFIFVHQNKLENEIKPHLSIQNFLQKMKPAFLNSEVWKCGFYTGLMNLPLMIISAMIGNLYLTEVLKFSLLDASLITSMISMGTIVASPLYGLLSDITQKKKPWMLLGALFTLLSFFVMMNVENPSMEMMIAIFFSLGFFSASQVLGYPMITNSAPEDLKGTSMGVAAVIIMGLAFVGQPLTGLLIDMASHDGVYDFDKALLIFPLGFIISLALSFIMKEKVSVTEVSSS